MVSTQLIVIFLLFTVLVGCNERIDQSLPNAPTSTTATNGEIRSGTDLAEARRGFHYRLFAEPSAPIVQDRDGGSAEKRPNTN